MNVYRILGISDGEDFCRHDPRGNFIPIERIDSVEKPPIVSNMIKDMVMSHIAGGVWSPSGILDMSFSEIMDNIISHSESPSFGIVGAQYYQNSKNNSTDYVEMCVADGGQGIVASMGANPNYKDFTPEEMMRRAIEQGYGQYIGMPAFVNEKTSGGMGLAYPNRLVRALGGKMWIVSHQYALEVSSDGINEISGLFYPGTIVSIRLPVKPGAVVMMSQMFPGQEDVPITWCSQEGWTDLSGSQLGVGGDADGFLW